MSIRIRTIPIVTAALLAVLLPLEEARAGKKRYVIEGTLSVEHHDFMKEALDRSHSPLENVLVKVSAKRKVGFGWGWYKSWGKVRTDEDGHFRIVKRKGVAKRKFKVQVRFRHSALEIRHEKSTADPLRKKVKWYKVYEEGSGDKSRHKDLTLRFGKSGNRTLDDREPWYHAEIWTLYWKAIRHMRGYGSHFAFRDKVKVKYPHSPWGDDSGRTSYANPLNNVIYIMRDGANGDSGRSVDTLLHELMHMWAYQHTRLENRMAEYLVFHLKKGTHGVVDKTHVAFHEGFAEWAKDVLKTELFPSGEGRDRTYRWTPRPFSHAGLINEDVDKFGLVDRSDDGWWNTFCLLQKADRWQFDWGTDADRLSRANRRKKDISPLVAMEVGRLTFPEVLAVIHPKGGKGMHARDMNWSDFFDRVVSRDNGLGEQTVARFRAMLDPQADREEVMAELTTTLELAPMRPKPLKPLKPVLPKGD